jgi:hypothetical protein
MGIILLNLLNGLAVGDTDAIRKNAETLSLVARVKLISPIDELFRKLSSWNTCFVKLTEKDWILSPNEQKSVGSTQLRSLLSIINKKRQRNKEWESSIGQDNSDMFTEKCCALRQEKMEKKLDETQQILMQILNRLDFRVSETTGVES